jgi:hypothetical protein
MPTLDLKAMELPDNLPKTRRLPRRKPGYVVIPADWLAALYRTPPVSRAAWVIAVRLIELFQMRKTKAVTLTNSTLKARGVGRWRKYEALRELEGLGLVAVETCRKVTWLVNPFG